MSENPDLLNEIRMLKEKIRLLEIENDLLSSRAEETVLLGQIVEQISSSTAIVDMIAAVLERISLLKDISFCGLFILEERTIEFVSYYLSYANDDLPKKQFLIDMDLAEDLHGGTLVLGRDESAHSGISISSTSVKYVPDIMLFIPSKTRWNQSAFFLFADRDHDERLTGMSELLHRIVEIVSARVENYALLHELKKFNEELDRKVEMRTQALMETNVLLQGEISEKKIIEKKLRESEARYRHLVESVTDYTYSVQIEDGKAIKISHGLGSLKVTGYSPSEYETDPGLWYRMIFENDKPMVSDQVNRVLAGENVKPIEHRLVHKTGEIRWVRHEIVPVLDVRGKVVAYDGLVSDISEQKRLQDQLRQIQKMEAIGTLTGGIAHDFNNILTAIIGYATLLLMKMEEKDPMRHNASQILASAEKAAYLTQSLLAFSRKQIMNPQPLNINELVRSMRRFLARLIGEDIELKTRIADDELMVVADGVQLEQVFMNLATNARDAMPLGGTLSITTEVMHMDDEYVRSHGYGEKGRYVLITFSDSGRGMRQEILGKIFEPFFTTKEKGRGTGLGLSIAYGIIKQHNGYINVYSEPGKGTTFKIYVPLTGQAPLRDTVHDDSPPLSGNETVLVAEDDNDARELTRCILEEYGYHVVLASDGEDAVRKYNENQENIDLLLFDVVMPKKNGKEAYEEIHALNPALDVLFVSGYTADIIQQKGILEGNVQILMKPVSPNELLKKIRSLLDKGSLKEKNG